ncbi:rho-related GTP-binding protein RhoU-like [Ciona intestinalis]
MDEARALPGPPREKVGRVKNPLAHRTRLKCLLCGDDGVGKHEAVNYDLYGKTKSQKQKVYKSLRKIDGKTCSLKYMFPTDEPEVVNVILYCFCIADEKSIMNLIGEWLPYMEKKYKDVPSILVGMQGELRSCSTSIPIAIDVVVNAAKKIGAKEYIECSANTGHNINKLFDFAFGLALDNATQPPLGRTYV